MGYIGSDPRNKDSVTTSQLVDDAVTNAKLVDDVLFSSVTSSIVSASGNITADTFTGTFNGALSSSVQIATSISGSSTSLSSSLSTRATTLESASGSFASDLVTLKGSGTAQGVGTSDSPTFADATITGTLTAQEVHTEFESASILFTSGSTKIGNSGDDIHQMTGSVKISGSFRAETSQIQFFDDNTEIGVLENSSENLKIESKVQDKDIIFSGNDGGAGIEAMRIDMSEGGKVGIGTSTVVSQLHLAKTSGEFGIKLTNNATGHTSSDGVHFNLDSNNDLNLGTKDSTNIVFKTADSERVRIKSDGKVGIGTNNPNELLHVEGSSPSIRIKASNEGGEPELKLQSDQGDDHDDLFSIRAVNEHALNIINFTGDTATSMMFISGSGNVGIGTVTPPHPFTVFRTGAGTVAQFGCVTVADDASMYLRCNGVFNFFTPGGGSIRFSSGGSEALTLDSSQNAEFKAQVQLKDGAYNNLSLNFANDTDTGLYLGGTNAIGFVTNGTVALELQGTQLADFRGDLQIPEYIKHSSDTDTFIRFTDNTINFSSGGSTTMQHINGGGIITHGATRATLTAGKTYGSGANVITFTVTVANVSSWEPINFLVEANYTLANLGGTGYYYGWGHTYHYSASGLAGTSTGNGGAQSNITVAVGNYSSNSFDITVTSGATSGTINMIASLDIRARHGISNIVAA